MTQTLPCPCCGKAYTVYSHYAFDQSACPECRTGKPLRDRVRPG